MADWADLINLDFGDAASAAGDAASSAVQAGGGGLVSGLVDWLKENPQLAGALFGASGPLAGLIGNLASGGISGTQSGSQSQSGSSSGSTSGFTNQQQTQQTDQGGFRDETITPTIDPAAQGAMDRLTAMLQGNQGGAQGAYNQGLTMLQQLATQGMGQMNGGGAPSPSAPNTTPSAAPVTGFPEALPTTYNPAIGNLIKQAFGSFVGDLGANAINNARGRGFAGGADLLNTAAAPMMGQTLAQVPAMEAKAYLDHVLQAYGLQSENAGRLNAANAQALNAATNALGPGVQRYAADVSKYGIDRNADNAQLGQMTSLLQALMGPQRDLLTANTNLLNAAPRGQRANTLSGQQTNQSLSGATQTGSQTQSNQQSQGQQSGQTATPIGNVIGTGVGNIIGGAGQGAVAGGAPDFTGAAARTGANNVRSILQLLGQRA